MNNKLQKFPDNNKSSNNIQNSATSMSQKQIKPPLSANEKLKKQNIDQVKSKISTSTSISERTLKQIDNDNSTQQSSTTKTKLVKNQPSDVSFEKKQVKRSDLSVDGGKSQRSTMSTSTQITQLSMLKKSSASVYGSEAGIKPVTKNPWAPIKNHEDKKISNSHNLKNSKSNIIIRSQSPQSARGLVKGVQNQQNNTSSSLQSKSKTNLKESSVQGIQLQNRKLVTQGINFGSFESISNKYIENQYNDSSQKYGEADDLHTLKKISNLSTQLQINQRRKFHKEQELLTAQYDLFLGEDSLKDKIKLTSRLNEYLQNSSSLNEKYDSLCNSRQENGNYVRINFEGRHVFLDIIKSQTSHSNQLPNCNTKETQKLNPGDNSEENKLQMQRKTQKAELCLWNTPQSIFKLDNQIDQIERIENLVEYLENNTQDITSEYQELVENQKYL